MIPTAPRLAGNSADLTAERAPDGSVRLRRGERFVRLPANWLRDQSTEPGQIDATSRQRLFTPRDLPADLTVTDVVISGGEGTDEGWLSVGFSDGHRAHLSVPAIERLLGWRADPEEPPSPEPWTAPLDPFPYVEWSEIGWSADAEDPAAIVRALGSFFRHGYVVFRNVPIEEGTIRRVAHRLGYLVDTTWGDVFDVRFEPSPTDLAYTSVELLAHCDLPYRRPAPGIQMLHCLANDAAGGDSTLVDGLAATDWLALADPAAFDALVHVPVVFRYDMGSDTVVSRGHVIELDANGEYVQLKFNTKLDTPIPRPGTEDVLDDWYRGRRLLTEWLNDSAHQVTFRLEPGDLMFMDNLRAAHGRTAFDPTTGRRHLQGAYIEHDGPDTRYRLAVRALAAADAANMVE